jgi:tetratricopeptide (TPR) repeat protein
MAANPKAISGERLDSWKQIAAFFDRAERTVKRWEAERGLPVHRVPGGGRSAVFAYEKELAAWLKGCKQELETDDPGLAELSQGKPSRSVADLVELNLNALQMAAPLANVSSSSPATSSSSARVVSDRPQEPVAHPPVERFQPIRLVAWTLPLLLAGTLVLYARHEGMHFKALASRHVPSAESQELYLKGRYFWDHRTPEDLNKAVDFFTQAIVKDPSDAEAYVGLADCYDLLREFGAMPASEAFPRALSAAQRAVELDDTLAEAHSSLAFVSFWWSWRGLTAEREFKRALELDPKLVRAHHWYATYLMGLHRYTEALEHIEQAQRLEPSSTPVLADKGLLLYEAGHHEEGIALLTQLESSQPSYSSTHAYLGRIYWQNKDYAKALGEWRSWAELCHDKDGLALADAREKGFHAGGLEGLLEAELPLEKDLVDRGSGSAFALAQNYAALGNFHQALAYLQVSFDRHEEAMLSGTVIPELVNDPQYLKLRAEVSRDLAR